MASRQTKRAKLIDETNNLFTIIIVLNSKSECLPIVGKEKVIIFIFIN